jgi:hypothetical protein
MGCAQSNVLQDDFFEAEPSPKSLTATSDKPQPDPKTEIKLLLLGASQSGKVRDFLYIQSKGCSCSLPCQSTLLKQMKVAFEGKYTQQELYSYRETILANTIQSLRLFAITLSTFQH